MVLNRESVFNPQLLVLELLSVSDDRRWVPGAKAGPSMSFRVGGDGLGFWWLTQEARQNCAKG